MIFKVNIKTSEIEPLTSAWIPKESVLEKCILPEGDADPILNPDVFKEPLLLISNQVKTRHKKRADILALDRMGNAVIIELKRDKGTLGVDTQVLQYLADFSAYQGMNFIKRFSKYSDALEDNIKSFVGDNVRIEDINRYSRIILMARSFDPSLYSMGKWLAKSNVAFRCIEYTWFEVNSEYFLSFSIAFDQSPSEIYPLSFQPQSREPHFFWHNIGHNTDEWWQYLVKTEQISASFSNQVGDEGERILRNYIQGDTIIAYAKGYGAVGWGTIEDPNSYKLLSSGSPGDKLHGFHLHRLKIKWKSVAKDLSDGLRPADVRSEYDIYHPISTSVKIDNRKGKRLIEELQRRFG